jgi:hypothetical protein
MRFVSLLASDGPSTYVNGAQRGVDWQMKIGDARCKLASVYPKIRL